MNTTFVPSPLIATLVASVFRNPLPLESTSAWNTVPATRSVTKACVWPGWVPPGTRFVAFDRNATYRPSALIDGDELAPFAGKPSNVWLARIVCGLNVFLKKMSVAAFVSPLTRFDASDW